MKRTDDSLDSHGPDELLDDHGHSHDHDGHHHDEDDYPRKAQPGVDETLHQHVELAADIA